MATASRLMDNAQRSNRLPAFVIFFSVVFIIDALALQSILSPGGLLSTVNMLYAVGVVLLISWGLVQRSRPVWLLALFLSAWLLVHAAINFFQPSTNLPITFDLDREVVRLAFVQVSAGLLRLGALLSPQALRWFGDSEQMRRPKEVEHAD